MTLEDFKGMTKVTTIGSEIHIHPDDWREVIEGAILKREAPPYPMPIPEGYQATYRSLPVVLDTDVPRGSIQAHAK